MLTSRKCLHSFYSDNVRFFVLLMSSEAQLIRWSTRANLEGSYESRKPQMMLEHEPTDVIAVRAKELAKTIFLNFKTTRISATNYMKVSLPGTRSDF